MRMRRATQLLLNASGLSAILFLSCARATGQDAKHFGDLYGIGAAGTIGRGTYFLPGGPSDSGLRTEERSFGPRAGGRRAASFTYSSGYSSPPMSYSVASSPRSYLTNRYYEPGDGYRYPLYYNPSTRTYFYYPVRR